MKKVLIGVVIFVIVLIAGISIIPLVFKDKIKQVLDQEIAKNINAEVIYQTDDVSLSLFRDFPNLSVGIDNLTIIGKDSFATDTLAYLPTFRMGLDLMSVISGDELKINSVNLEQPKINLIVLKSGKANWDIVIPDTAAPEMPEDTIPSEFKMAIKGWEMDNGTISYTDLSIPMVVTAYNVQHSGTGDFEQDVFDMKTKTESDNFTFVFDNMSYISKARLEADVTMAMDLNKFLYTFKDNDILINKFRFGFDGSILMPADDIDLDLTFAAKETDFKNLFSIIPGTYTEQFDDIKTDGKIAFNGYVKGRFNETSMPGFGLDLKVNDAMFKYPDLPETARNINVDLSVANKDGNVNNTNIVLRQFHLDLGKNPVDAKATINGLEPMQVDGNLKANLNLAEMTKVFPVEGMVLRGLLKIDADAKGTYSETQMPVINADLNLSNGYVKSADFPAPIEQLQVVMNVLNTTGNTDDTKINIKNFNMLLEGEPFAGNVYIEGIDKPVFDAKVNGTLNLTKLTKIFPIEGTTLSGIIKANIATSGKMADIEAERYANVKASGTMNVSNLIYEGTDMPQGMRINTASANFNNDKIVLENLDGYIGKSDMKVNGTISNYMGYMFTDTQPLRGTMNFNSNTFNVNEWMVDDATGASTSAQNQSAGASSSAEPGKEAEGVVEVPANIDFVLNASVNKVLYDNLVLDNMKGKVIIKDKIARLENVTFNTLGGSFATSGSYNTQSLQNPLFDMKLNITSLEFKKAFNAFNTMQTIAPIAKLLDGTFNTSFSFNGKLGQDMMPVYSSLNGSGVIDVIKAAVRNVPILTKIGDLTKINELKNLIVENKKIDAQIVNGSFLVKPFDLDIGNMKMTIGGSNAPDGTIDYATALNIPAGKVGTALNSKLSSLTGKDIKQAERITLNLNIGGTLTDPKVSLAGGDVKEQAKEQVKEVVKDLVDSKVNEAKANLEAKRKAAEDSIRNLVEQRKKAAQDSIQRELDRKKREAEENLKKQAEDKLKGIFKR